MRTAHRRLARLEKLEAQGAQGLVIIVTCIGGPDRIIEIPSMNRTGGAYGEARLPKDPEDDE
jgi:hypothetical protein